jgi:hypothetical protein
MQFSGKAVVQHMQGPGLILNEHHGEKKCLDYSSE